MAASAKISTFYAQLTGTSLTCSDTVFTYISRTASIVKIGYSTKLAIRYEAGNTTAGFEEYKCRIDVGGTNLTDTTVYDTYKEMDEPWKYGDSATISGTIEVPISKNGATTANIQFRFYTKTYNGDYEYSDWKTAEISVPNYITIPSAPKNLKFGSAHYLPNEAIALSWDKASGTVAGYKIEYKIDGGSWIALDNVTENSVSYTDIELSFRQSIVFRVAAYNEAGTSEYVESIALVCAGGTDININGTNKAGTVFVNVGGVWKKGIVYTKQNDEWHISV